MTLDQMRPGQRASVREVGGDVVLEEVLCVREERVVGQDWCVRWMNRWLQIGQEHRELRLPRRRVMLKALADGRLVMEHGQKRLSFTELSSRPVVRRRKAKRRVINNVKWKPGADHPWNRGGVGQAVPRVSPAPAAPTRHLHAEKKRKAG